MIGMDGSLGYQRGFGAEGPRRVEVITGQERRRRWPRDQRALITEESLEPGANVAEIARRYGVSVGLLHYWRKCVREASDAATSKTFLPVTLAEDEIAPAPRLPAARGASIEIACGRIVVRINGSVDRETLRTVLAAVQRG